MFALTEINLSKVNLEEIGSSAFRDTGLKKVTFPASLKKIAPQAFLNTQLVNVIFPEELQEIGNEAFREIATLKTITLPNNLRKIGYRAFMECSKLKEIILPKYVRRIKDYGLRTNYKLDRIRFEGDEVPEIGNYSLPFLESITEIMVPKGKLSLYKAKYQDYQSIIIETP